MEEKIDKQKSSFGIASLVLGILSIVFTLFYYISIPTGILGIVFGAKSIKKVGSKLGKAGLITGIIGLSICALIYVSCIILMYLGEAY